MTNSEFERFLAAVRVGDQRAAEELVRHYEPYIRRVVRLRLTDEGLRRVFDSMDICQSILAKFFAGASQGRFTLHSARQLRGLLATMALNNLRGKARRQRKLAEILPQLQASTISEITPGEQAARKEMIEAVKQKMSPAEWRILDLRAQGLTWSEIAQEVGGSPDALRIQQARAIARIQRELQREDQRDGP